MSTDRELLADYFDQLRDRFYGYEIVERLEEAGVLSVDDVLSLLEDYIVEGRQFLDE